MQSKLSCSRSSTARRPRGSKWPFTTDCGMKSVSRPRKSCESKSWPTPPVPSVSFVAWGPPAGSRHERRGLPNQGFLYLSGPLLRLVQQEKTNACQTDTWKNQPPHCPRRRPRGDCSRGHGTSAAPCRKPSLPTKASSEQTVTDEMMSEFKTAVSKVLTPYASAILLDPEWGLAAAKARSSNAGLLLSYEKSGYDNNRPGRLADVFAQRFGEANQRHGRKRRQGSDLLHTL